MRRDLKWPINFWRCAPLPWGRVKQISRADRAPHGHFDPDAVRHGGLRVSRAFMCLKCVGEDNVIDPLQGWLK